MRRTQYGFTFTELLVVVAILGLLSAIIIPSYEAIKRRAEKARCIGNLKVLHSGFDAFVLDNNYWPQMPEESMDWEESKYFEWWTRILEPYGVGQESWLCSSDRILELLPENQGQYYSSYVPTRFNSHRFTPYRWNQPWVVERGDYHGKGAHVLMPDGSITTSQSPWGER
ncbi:MAG: prepilin-type N-terminal cleavage/methylation domain-containing protein [Verrucomicrobiae bacterium]|nr:prepilin-type N-terminal cleavage/methylation domain-containing protein [Verrucomicrobiae bacterium]